VKQFTMTRKPGETAGRAVLPVDVLTWARPGDKTDRAGPGGAARGHNDSPAQIPS
jgi:hypothetical protein